MSPGHTKFDPDLIAAVIGTAYNNASIFNLGMLAELIQKDASCVTYNSVGLQMIRDSVDKAGNICRRWIAKR